MDHPVFREVQQFRQPWLWALMAVTGLAVVLGMGAVLLAWSRGEGTVWLVLGIGLIAVLEGALFWFLWYGALITEVGDDALSVRFRPFKGRQINYGSIQSAVAREYSPIREFGGWGYRIGPHSNAYNVSGNRGVQLTFTDGKPLLIGSQESEALAAAIYQHL